MQPKDEALRRSRRISNGRDLKNLFFPKNATILETRRLTVPTSWRIRCWIRKDVSKRAHVSDSRRVCESLLSFSVMIGCWSVLRAAPRTESMHTPSVYPTTRDFCRHQDRRPSACPNTSRLAVCRKHQHHQPIGVCPIGSILRYNTCGLML